MEKSSKFNEKYLFRYFTGDISRSEVREIQEWLDQDRLHRQQFAAFKKLYMEIAANFQKEQINSDAAYRKFISKIEESEELLRLSGQQKKSSLFRFLRYAAIIIIIVSLATGTYIIGQRTTILGSEGTCEIQVPYGGKSNVVLPDGSKVWLNAGSKIRYNRQFNYKNREVYLEGEAYFDVEKSRNPFIVHTSYYDVHVLGTVFNVKSYPDDENIETTLVEGKIRIETPKSDGSIYLEPNQKLTYNKKGDITEIIDNVVRKLDNIDKQSPPEILKPGNDLLIEKHVNVVEATSWKSGTLIFNREPLENLAKKLERKFDISFEFESDELRNYTYSGTLRDFPLEQVLHALELSSDIKYDIHEKSVRLYLENKN